MRRLLLPLLLLTSCEEDLEPDIEGRLVAVEVVTERDTCVPQRHQGDGGVQFIGLRADGGVVFTMARNAAFGPLPDGTTFDSVSRHSIPVDRGGWGNAAEGDVCAGIFHEWTLVDDNTLTLFQDLPSTRVCTSGPVWLPKAEDGGSRCETAREYRLTDVGTCKLSCVKFGVSGDVTCECD